ncbi:mortality factor 4-like protein 1 [Ciona intestinalis]
MSTVNRKTLDKRFKFSEGEKVLCFQGPLVYEAKCLKLEASEDETASYFVHYNGWNKHWDEWVPESRVMKYNETNLQKQKDLLKQFGKEKSRGSSDGRERPKRSKSVKEKPKVEKEPENKPEVRRTSVDLSVTSNPTNQEPKRKKARVESVEEKEEVEIVHEMFDTSLNIPHELGVMLADDWDLINHQKQLYDLPAKVTVEDILNKYLESRNNLSIVTQQSSIQLKEMVLGLSEYFSVMLGSQLLYKFERPQFGDILDKYPDRTASQIYGCPHFLRFFVRVRSTVASQSLLNDNSLVILITSIRDCLEFLKDEAASWFNINDYVIAPAEYHRRAMT